MLPTSEGSQKRREACVFKTPSNKWMLPSWRGKALTFSNSATTHSPRTEHTVCSMGSEKLFLSHCSLLEHSPWTAITHPPRETGSDKQQRTEEYVGLHRDTQDTDAHTEIQKRPVNTHSDTHSQRRLDVPRNKLAFIHLDLHSRRPMDVQFQTQAHSRSRALMGTSHLGIWSPEKYIDI